MSGTLQPAGAGEQHAPAQAKSGAATATASASTHSDAPALLPPAHGSGSGSSTGSGGGGGGGAAHAIATGAPAAMACIRGLGKSSLVPGNVPSAGALATAGNAAVGAPPTVAPPVLALPAPVPGAPAAWGPYLAARTSTSGSTQVMQTGPNDSSMPAPNSALPAPGAGPEAPESALDVDDPLMLPDLSLAAEPQGFAARAARSGALADAAPAEFTKEPSAADVDDLLRLLNDVEPLGGGPLHGRLLQEKDETVGRTHLCADTDLLMEEPGTLCPHVAALGARGCPRAWLQCVLVSFLAPLCACPALVYTTCRCPCEVATAASH